MVINTRDFGEIEVADENIVTFPAGVYAFEDAREFALISPLGDDVYPKWLQSVNDVMPCFIVFDPAIAVEEYCRGVKLESSDAKLLKIDGESADMDSIRFLAIATVPSDFKKTTLNMKAPIAINTDCNLAAQVILPAECGYDFRFPLYSEEEVC
jgi:flagellar assembly factor FliW